MTIVTPARVTGYLAMLAGLTLGLGALVGCDDGGAADADPPEPIVVEPAVAEPVDEQPRRKTSVIGAPIQKAEDVRDLVGDRQRELLDQINSQE